ncbi:MAG: phosphate ABC transporter, permease protein PstA [Thiobacillus sp. 65-69]|nr:phosphate ABC transporter permease PstA [Thiobacillus sp.]ODU86963.1 MAG: phosphate ABC transporter, permease protein PstA [Thiobacillus sp. SCN 65-179]OJW36743.1 MAG: phosphate ABC transporter, permease protein PstA [Thiobacillus sp. 65-69]
MRNWFKGGEPWIWMTAGAVALSLVSVYAVLWMTAAQGLGHWWPKPLAETTLTEADGSVKRLIGELRDKEEISLQRLRESGYDIKSDDQFTSRYLFKQGNRDVYGVDFKWIPAPLLGEFKYPKDVIAIERHEWGSFFGHLKAVKENGQVVAEGKAAWPELEKRLARSNALFDEILSIEKQDIGKVNYNLERLRLKQRKLELQGGLTEAAQAGIDQERQIHETEFARLQARLDGLRAQNARDSLTAEIQDGQVIEIPFGKIADVIKPNDMSVVQKISHYLQKLSEFIVDDPREANTEGGIFPAIFGTVMMVLLMSAMVTPLGIMAAVYMREYARQGPLIQIIRISVNNLAGVPSIVYGVFGLGFFIYFLGGNIDALFFPEASPAPVFGSPGILWSSLTLALLTLPVVIVATEEGLSRVPRSIREGSLALGATKAETLWRTVLPIASPAMMTGLILAVARAAGEVAPLMLVGVVKLAPSLPLDGNFPFLHLERKFMHLGFHIYDVGFQSPNVEAARPLVFATSLLLVIIIIVLNMFAIRLRNRLRERMRGLESV